MYFINTVKIFFQRATTERRFLKRLLGTRVAGKFYRSGSLCRTYVAANLLSGGVTFYFIHEINYISLNIDQIYKYLKKIGTVHIFFCTPNNLNYSNVYNRKILHPRDLSKYTVQIQQRNISTVFFNSQQRNYIITFSTATIEKFH